MRIRKLKNKIVIFVVAIILMVGFLSAYFIASYAKRAVVANKKEEIKIEMETASKKIETFLVQQQQYIENISTQYALVQAIQQGGNLQENREVSILLSGLSAKGVQDKFLILDLAGDVLASNDPAFLGNNYSFRDYFKKGLEDGNAIEIIIGSVTKKRTIVFSHTIFSEDGQALGLMVETVSIDTVNDLLVDNFNSIDHTNYVHMMLDDNAVVIKASDHEYENKVIGNLDNDSLNLIRDSKKYGDFELGTLPYDKLLTSIRTATNTLVYDFYDYKDGQQEIIGSTKIGQFPFYIAIELREVNYLESIRGAYYNIAVAVSSLGLLAIICVLYFVGRFLRPLKQLKNATEKISQGDFDFTLSVKSGDEFQDLADAFNVMSQSLLKSKHDMEVILNRQTGSIDEKRIELENQKKAALNILEDVAEEKERSESILRFLKSIGDGVIAVDLNGKVIFFNDAAEKMFEISAEEAMGKDVCSVAHIFTEADEESKENVCLDLFSDLQQIKQIAKHYTIRKDGKVKMSISMNVSNILGSQNEKQGHILVLRNVTEERNIEKTKDEFLSVAAHQLRTPLTGIRWSLEMLADGDVGKLTKDAKQLVDKIIENNKRLTLLVNDLLDVSRINMGKASEEATNRDVIHTVEKSIETLSDFASSRNVLVVMKKSDKNDLFVHIGHKKFFQALENLISNAIKYSPNGGKVTAGIEVKNDKVIISVSDKGIGIPIEDQKNIFTKFFRAKNAAIKDTEGSGLGLNVVKSYIEEAGGRVWFESEIGKGTTFFIEMDLVK